MNKKYRWEIEQYNYVLDIIVEKNWITFFSEREEKGERKRRQFQRIDIPKTKIKYILDYLLNAR